MNTHEVFSAENTRHLDSEEDMERLRATALQVAWAEQESELARERGEELDIEDWMISHGEWYRKEVIEKPENHSLIDRFENEPDQVIAALKKLYAEYESATKH